MFKKILNWLLRFPKCTVSREQAIAIASEYCQKMTIPLLNPRVVEDRHSWTIYTEGRKLRGSAWVEISKNTGQILGTGQPPR